MTRPPEGYLGADALIRSGPAPELVQAGYALEIADAPLLHRGLTVADLAHLIALNEVDVVPRHEARRLASALLDLLDVDVADFPYDVTYGDAYNSRERVLESQLGTTAGWLHTGRTRREAGRIAFRLALRDELLQLHDAVCRFVAAATTRAEAEAETLWNDTTYLQPAQPSTFGHYLLGFAVEAERHLDRIEAAHTWADRSPAGVGGVGGTTIPLDRDRLTELLGFAVSAPHTRDAMWATDGLVDAVTAAAQAATTVDRLAEDLEVMATPQFAYVTLDASMCRASVQMPQKRNPYALAVIRGGASTLLGRVAGSLATQRTPSARTDNWLHAYGETVGALQLADRVVSLGAAVVETLHIDGDRLRGGAGADFSCATDLTDVIVMAGGIDYRSAYRMVGAAVAAAVAEGRDHLRATDLASSGVAVERLQTALDPERAVAARSASGGSAPAAVRDGVRLITQRAAERAAWRAAQGDRRDRSEESLLAAARALISGEG